MRKYQQLILLIFSFISLILVLVYRHQYNRLHYVLEVFNFFGTPCNFSGLNTSDTFPYHFDWGQNPVWQNNEGYYTFSGFTNGSWSQAIVVQKLVSKRPKKCYLWFEDRHPMIGEMTAKELTGGDDYKVFTYNCQLRYSKTLPYAVSFGTKSKLSKLIILTHIDRKAFTVSSTLCVLPSIFNKRQLIEFISFHKLIGFKYFIFYYNDLPYHLLKFLTNLSEIVDADFTFYPWNSPFSSGNVSRIVIEKDCLLRTSVKSKTAIVLGLNEFLVPSDSYGIYPLLESNYHGLRYIDIPVQRICLQRNDTFRPLILQNKNSYNDDAMRIVKFNFNNHVGNNTGKQIDQRFHMVVLVYENCDGYEGRFYENKLMNRYSTDLSRSTLMRLLHDDQI